MRGKLPSLDKYGPIRCEYRTTKRGAVRQNLDSVGRFGVLCVRFRFFVCWQFLGSMIILRGGREDACGGADVRCGCCTAGNTSNRHAASWVSGHHLICQWVVPLLVHSPAETGATGCVLALNNWLQDIGCNEHSSGMLSILTGSTTGCSCLFASLNKLFPGIQCDYSSYVLSIHWYDLLAFILSSNIFFSFFLLL